MASFNRIIIAGNLTRDPEFKEIAAGQSVCRLALASNRQYKNRQTGAVAQEVCFVDVDVWGPQAESCRTYLQKGRAVLIEGRLKYDTWKDAEGNTRSRHSIMAERVVFLGSRSEAEAGNGGAFMDDAGIANEAPVSFGAASTTAPVQTPRAPRAPKKQPAANTPDMDALFKDQPPFEEELPF